MTYTYVISSLTQVAQRAEEACSLIKSDMFEECWSIKDYAYYYSRCMIDYCMRGDNSDVPVCNHASALARECALEGVEIRWREDPRASSRCRKYSTNIPITGHESPLTKARSPSKHYMSLYKYLTCLYLSKLRNSTAILNLFCYTRRNVQAWVCVT